MELSIIIVEHNSAAHLNACLHSIAKYFRKISHEIIIVNNGNENIGAFDFGIPIKKIIPSANHGFGGACNRGSQEASGKILLFLNPDAVFFDGDPREILAIISKKSSAIVSPQIIQKNGAVQPFSAGGAVNLGKIILNNVSFFLDKKYWLSSQKISVEWVSGAALFINRNFFKSLRGFDEKFFMYFEDIDLCHRALKSGGKILLYPYIKVCHSGGASFAAKKIQKKFYRASQKYYFSKHASRLEFFLYTIIEKLA